jgi:hypothetical protein
MMIFRVLILNPQVRDIRYVPVESQLVMVWLYAF